VEVLVAVLDAAADRAPLERRFDESVAAARLEALREFAYGAGHEINNPLANIATRAQALLLDEKDPERRRRLAAIVDQAFRARDMIGGLMVFARPPKAVPAATAVDGILATVVEAVRPLAQAREARLECSPPPAPLLVFVGDGRRHAPTGLRPVLQRPRGRPGAGARAAQGLAAAHDERR
jgi:signal transduction histidine kinase